MKNNKINSLPNIKIPLIGIHKISIGATAIPLKNYIDSIEQFEKEYRGPILSFCIRTEQTINELIVIICFYLLSIGFNKGKQAFFEELIFNTGPMSLNAKFFTLIKLINYFEIQQWGNIEKTKEGTEKFKKCFTKFKNIRNIFAHGQIKAEINVNSIVDIYLVSNRKKHRIDENYIKNIVNDIYSIENLLYNYKKNFNIERT